MKKEQDTSAKAAWKKFPVLDISADASVESSQTNKYIMMAHIMRGAMERSGYIKPSDRNKYCDATKTTLEFAESIKSDVGICGKIPESYWTGTTLKEENCDLFDKIKTPEYLKQLLDKCSKHSEKKCEDTIARGGGIIEVSPEMTCNYKFSGNYKPKIINGTIGKLLGTINNTNFYNRLNKMSFLLNGSRRIRSKINKPSIRTARFRTKNRKGLGNSLI